MTTIFVKIFIICLLPKYYYFITYTKLLSTNYKIPAKILRLNNVIGTLEVGKDADFNIFNLNEGEDYNAVLNKEKPDFVYIKGSRVVENGNIRQKIKA